MVTPFFPPQDLRSYGGAPVDVFEAFAFHTCSTICLLVFGDLVGTRVSLWGNPGGPKAFGVGTFG